MHHKQKESDKLLKEMRQRLTELQEERKKDETKKEDFPTTRKTSNHTAARSNEDMKKGIPRKTRKVSFADIMKNKE